MVQSFFCDAKGKRVKICYARKYMKSVMIKEKRDESFICGRYRMSDDIGRSGKRRKHT